MKSAAERDHEIRNLVAGLSGAASLLTGDGTRASTPDGQRLLVAAGAELERLKIMMSGERADTTTSRAVSVLRDLVTLHRAGGLDVELEQGADATVAIDRVALTQVVTNLLVNCARHAPGAKVRIRTTRRGDRLRIEVCDDGPGLPPGSAGLLVRGARGSASTGEGLGLAIIADLVQRHGGTFALVSGRRGCTAIVDVPVARAGATARLYV